MAKARKLLLLTGDCSAKGCRKRSVVAKQWIPGMWLELCNDHQGKEWVIDMHKVGHYIAEGSIALRPAPAGKCRYCGCTETLACVDGCNWIEPTSTVCSSEKCVKKFEAMCEAAQR